MRTFTRLLLGAALAVALGHPRAADATPLNLVLPEAPDILSQFIDLIYDADTDSLTASGFSLEFRLDGTTVAIDSGTFDISIVTDGVTASGSAGDDLAITGSIDVDGDTVADYSGTLLTGAFSAFGSSATGPGVFEFLFDVTGGELVPDFFGLPQAGVILTAGGNSSYTGSFDADFDNLDDAIGSGSGSGSSDTAPVPEPGTVLLTALGVSVLALRRRALA